MSEYLQKMAKAGYELDKVIPIDIFSYSELLVKLEKEPKPVIISTGEPDLDEFMSGGFQEGRLYVLSAPTKQGKTTMAQTFMWNMARQNNASLIFSYEMGWQEIVNKFVAMDKVNNVETHNLPLYLPIDLHRGGGELQYQWLYEAIAKAKEEKNIKLVVIDHLHFLLPLKDFQNLSIIMGGIVREIKRMAVALKIPIILIAHTQKIKDDKKPDWTDIRDSSLITQEADVVLMIYRIKETSTSNKVTDESTTEVYTKKAILSVEVDRVNGRSGKVLMWHNGAGFEKFDNQKHGSEDFAFTAKIKLQKQKEKDFENFKF